MSSPVYELLKRPDELFVVEHAHLQPRFVEDSVRLALAGALERYPELDDGDFLLSRQVNLETIHDHDVLAERYGTAGELRGELETGTPVGPAHRAPRLAHRLGHCEKVALGYVARVRPRARRLHALDSRPSRRPAGSVGAADGERQTRRAPGSRLRRRSPAARGFVRKLRRSGHCAAARRPRRSRSRAADRVREHVPRQRVRVLGHRSPPLASGLRAAPAPLRLPRRLRRHRDAGRGCRRPHPLRRRRVRHAARARPRRRRRALRLAGARPGRTSSASTSSVGCSSRATPSTCRQRPTATCRWRASSCVCRRRTGGSRAGSPCPTAWAAAAASGASAAQPFSRRRGSVFVATGNAYEGGQNVRPRFRESAGLRGAHRRSSPRRCSCAPRTTRRPIIAPKDLDFCERPGARAAARLPGARRGDQQEGRGSTPGGRTASATVRRGASSSRRRASSSQPAWSPRHRSFLRHDRQHRRAGSRSQSPVARAWSGRARASTRRDRRRSPADWSGSAGTSAAATSPRSTRRPAGPAGICPVNGTPLAAPAVLRWVTVRRHLRRLGVRLPPTASGRRPAGFA